MAFSHRAQTFRQREPGSPALDSPVAV